jgi:hypothetical protein
MAAGAQRPPAETGQRRVGAAAGRKEFFIPQAPSGVV